MQGEMQLAPGQSRRWKLGSGGSYAPSRQTSKGTAGHERRSDPFCDPPKVVGDTGLGLRHLMPAIVTQWIALAVRLITSPVAMRLFVTPSTPRSAEIRIYGW